MSMRSADKYISARQSTTILPDDSNLICARPINLNPRFPKQPMSNRLNSVDGDDRLIDSTRLTAMISLRPIGVWILPGQ